MSENNKLKLLGGYESKLSAAPVSFKFNLTMTGENSEILGVLNENDNGQLEFEGRCNRECKGFL